MNTDKLLEDAWNGLLHVFATTDPEEYSRRAPYVLYADLLPTRRIRTKHIRTAASRAHRHQQPVKNRANWSWWTALIR